MGDHEIDMSRLVGWYSPPNLRRTFDIVWGCVLTVFICTWTANHVNVPPYGSTSKWRFLYKLKITMLSLLTPEYTAALAAVDLRSAVILTRRMRKLGHEEWTTKHSFFVIMGAYMIECEKRYTPLDVDEFLKLLENRQLQVATLKQDTVTTKPETTSKMTVVKSETWPVSPNKSLKQSTKPSKDNVIMLP